MSCPAGARRAGPELWRFREEYPAWQTGFGSERAPGSVKLRTGGDSPRPGRVHRPVDPVEFRDRRLKSGWEAARARRMARPGLGLAVEAAAGAVSASSPEPVAG